MEPAQSTARLTLEDGSTFAGRLCGFPTSVAGEVVFNTGMVGSNIQLAQRFIEALAKKRAGELQIKSWNEYAPQEHAPATTASALVDGPRHASIATAPA